MPWLLVVGDYGVRWSTCNFPVFKSVYTYKASECKCAIIRLHCATSKSSLWNMEYVARGGAFERPHIYRTIIYVHEHVVFTVYGICTARGLYVLPRVEPEEVHTAQGRYYPMHCKNHETAVLYR